jgi:hypothetical protein
LRSFAEDYLPSREKIRRKVSPILIVEILSFPRTDTAC